MTAVESAQADVNQAKHALTALLPSLLEATHSEWARFSSKAARSAVESQTHVTEEMTNAQLTELKRALLELDAVVDSDIDSGLRERLEAQINAPATIYSQFQQPKDLVSEVFREYEKELWKRLNKAGYREMPTVEKFEASGDKTKYDRVFAELLWSWISKTMSLMKASTALSHALAAERSASAGERWDKA